MKINLRLIIKRAISLAIAGIIAGGLAIEICGCAQSPQIPKPPPLNEEPVGMQIVRKDASLKGLPFRVLLDFECGDDLTFIARPAAATSASQFPSEGAGSMSPYVTQEIAHTGSHSLALPPGIDSFSVKLSELPGMDLFPGRWKLVGGFFYAQQPLRVTAEYVADGRALASHTTAVGAHQWKAVLLDVSPLADPNHPPPPVGLLRFRWEGGPQTIWCDDVLVIDNEKQLAAAGVPPVVSPVVSLDGPPRSGAPATNRHAIPPAAPSTTQSSADGWPAPATQAAADARWGRLSAQVKGFRLILDSSGVFHLELPLAEGGESGWEIVEVSPERVQVKRALTARASEWWTLYADGREYADGKFAADASQPKGLAETLADEHSSPAEIIVPPELGRVDRNTIGDADNDGYNEHTGAYQLIARGARLEATIIPHTRVLQDIVLEVAGLPPGKVIVTMEGQLISQVLRLDNGHVLVEIPNRIERETTLQMHVK